MLSSALRPATDPDRPEFSLGEALHATNINAETGLATDYLNHFNEFVMLLDILDPDEDITDDILTWCTISYGQHFEQSGFRDRDLVIQSYEAAPARYRTAFDRTVSELNALILATQDAVRNGTQAPSDLAMTSDQIRVLIARAGSIVNGSVSFDANSDVQDAVDALFE